MTISRMPSAWMACCREMSLKVSRPMPTQTTMAIVDAAKTGKRPSSIHDSEGRAA